MDFYIFILEFSKICSQVLVRGGAHEACGRGPPGGDARGEGGGARSREGRERRHRHAGHGHALQRAHDRPGAAGTGEEGARSLVGDAERVVDGWVERHEQE